MVIPSRNSLSSFSYQDLYPLHTTSLIIWDVNLTLAVFWYSLMPYSPLSSLCWSSREIAQLDPWTIPLSTAVGAIAVLTCSLYFSLPFPLVLAQLAKRLSSFYSFGFCLRLGSLKRRAFDYPFCKRYPPIVLLYMEVILHHLRIHSQTPPSLTLLLSQPMLQVCPIGSVVVIELNFLIKSLSPRHLRK